MEKLAHLEQIWLRMTGTLGGSTARDRVHRRTGDAGKIDHAAGPPSACESVGTLNRRLRILDDCLLNDSELEQFQKSAPCIPCAQSFGRLWLAGTEDTYPPDTYFGIEVGI